MKKISTVDIERIQIFKENQLTIGLDLEIEPAIAAF